MNIQAEGNKVLPARATQDLRVQFAVFLVVIAFITMTLFSIITSIWELGIPQMTWVQRVVFGVIHDVFVAALGATFVFLAVAIFDRYKPYR